MSTIKGAVGPGQRNDPADVRRVQELLVRHRQWLAGRGAPAITGRLDPVTAQAIVGFQTEGASLKHPNGVVAPGTLPGGLTLERLEMDRIAGPRHRVFLAVCWYHPNDLLTEADYATAAARIGCDVAAIKTVAQVEARGAPWTPGLEAPPKILYERHKFRLHTKPIGHYDSTHPDLSSETPGGYVGETHEHAKLKRAAMLDEQAALKACSWGMFQILGENYMEAGFPSVEAFVAAMLLSRKDHLRAFAQFVAYDVRKKKAIIDHDWARFARLYNGKGYKKNHYDENLARAYGHIAGAAGGGGR